MTGVLGYYFHARKAWDYQFTANVLGEGWGFRLTEDRNERYAYQNPPSKSV